MSNALQLRPYQSESVESLRDGFRANHTQIKSCSKCNKEKPIGAFNKKTASKDGMQPRCKQCQADWQSSNPEKARANTAKWRALNLELYKSLVAARRAANRGSYRAYEQNRRARMLAIGGKLSVGLAVKLFQLQQGKCPCCALPLGDNYHLDHKMPLGLGGAHSDENMQLLRQQCNNEKHVKHPVAFMQSRGFLL